MQSTSRLDVWAFRYTYPEGHGLSQIRIPATTPVASLQSAQREVKRLFPRFSAYGYCYLGVEEIESLDSTSPKPE